VEGTFENVMPRAAVCHGIALADQEREERDVLQRQSRQPEALISLRDTHTHTHKVSIFSMERYYGFRV
jgi:hypothetical protein